GQPLAVDASGRISGSVQLQPGLNPVEFRVHDPEGQTGTLQRDFEVVRDGVFLVAFADGEFGNLEIDGRVDAAGREDGFYHEGRLAYYLKGWVKGRFLVTSAFDSERGEVDDLFRDLGPDETDRFFRSLDPDRLYPVYGDASVTTWDAESQGKFYLAVEAEEGSALFGNYPVDFGDVELAQYRRTLYGGQIEMRSLAETEDGAPRTRAIVFGADVNRVHVRNEVRASGGSLYYMSHRDVVEGSEQVALVVRDRNTGLLLQRTTQRRDRDYTIKYEEGRIHFRGPVSGFRQDGGLVQSELLAGHPVWVEVDFEAREEGFSETAFGARARHRLGLLDLGATWVDDPQAAGDYRMEGVDAALNVRPGTRIVAEYAESRGSDARTYRSEDGGLGFAEVSADGSRDGTAWKIAAEIDAGDWVEAARGLRIGAYHKNLGEGFASGTGSFERGAVKSGGHVGYGNTSGHSVDLRYQRETVGDQASHVGSVLWRLTTKRWDWAAEVEDRATDGASGLDRTSAAVEVATRLGDRWDAALSRQQTLSGDGNDQTTLRVGYRALARLHLDARGMIGERGESTQFGAAWELPEGRLYLNERAEFGGRDRRRATVVGAESRIGPGTRVYSEYQWERSAAGPRAVSVLGAGQTWEPGAGLRLAVTGELSGADGGSGATERSAATAGLTWDAGGIRARSRQEIRLESGAARRKQLVTENRLDVSMSPDFTLLGKLRLSRTEDRDDGSLEARLDERSVGLAYRPVRHDRFNGMARYTHLVDRRPPDGAGQRSPERTLDVMSLEGVVDIVPRLQWYGKGAARIREERDPLLPDLTTHTFLGLQRVDVTVRHPVDLGLEYRLLRQRETEDTLQGWLAEISGKVRPRLRIGVGFNFTDFSDDEFEMNDYSVRGWFLRLQGKY
ncbi:MAG: hypothetical protein HKN12_04515, partial [Gemmatimonadetes bacterium]|nr:hypothetical protein [Gemmatimonadota bacterium]